jgi:hypothetical protein
MSYKVVFLFMSKECMDLKITLMNKHSKFQMLAEAGEEVPHEGAVEAGRARLLWSATNVTNSGIIRMNALIGKKM